MAFRVVRGFALAFMTLLSLGVVALAERSRTLPDFALRDPAGRLHTRASLASHGLVVLVTAPTLASEDDQRAWDGFLCATRPDAASAQLAFVEDLDQSWFPDRAARAMREEYDPKGVVVVLVDREGALRRALRVDEGRTVLFAFDASGNRRFAHSGEPSEAAARRAWEAADAPQHVDESHPTSSQPSSGR